MVRTTLSQLLISTASALLDVAVAIEGNMSAITEPLQLAETQLANARSAVTNLRSKVSSTNSLEPGEAERVAALAEGLTQLVLLASAPL